jgi:hypothetical protein
MKRGSKDKKGSGHLEMMFAFVFFLGFIFFLFVIIKPYDEEILPDSIVRGLASSFEEQTSTNLTSFYLQVRYPQGFNKNCFKINEIPVFKFTSSSASNSSVTDIDGNFIESKLVPGGNFFIKDNTKRDFRVLMSPDFIDAEFGGCDMISEDNYTIGNLLERKVISYSSVVNMKNRYETEYENLKNDLGVPPIYDFAILSSDELLNMDRGRPSSTEAYAKNFIYEVLKSDGTLINARFVINVW